MQKQIYADRVRIVSPLSGVSAGAGNDLLLDLGAGRWVCSVSRVWYTSI